MLKRPERYTALLRIRQREEDARAAALAKATGAVRNAESRREELVGRHTETLERAAEATRGTDAARMERFSFYERHITQLIAHADRDIDQLQTDRETRQEEFESSHRRRRMIDRLIERTAHRWRAHVDHEERKALEESVAMRYAYRRNEGAAD